MALFNIGGVRAELHPFNLDRAQHETNEDFAKHPVLGARQTFESVGHGDETLQLRGTLFPRKIGGMAEIALLTSLQQSAQAVLVTRGNENLGWFHIMRIGRDHSFLDAQGMGQKVAIRIDLELTDRPSSIDGVGDLLVRLFGYA